MDTTTTTTTTTKTTPPTLEEQLRAQFAALTTAELPGALRALGARLTAELVAQKPRHLDRQHLGSSHFLGRVVDRLGRAEGGVRMAAEELEAVAIERSRAEEHAKNEK